MIKVEKIVAELRDPKHAERRLNGRSSLKYSKLGWKPMEPLSHQKLDMPWPVEFSTPTMILSPIQSWDTLVRESATLKVFPWVYLGSLIACVIPQPREKQSGPAII